MLISRVSSTNEPHPSIFDTPCPLQPDLSKERVLANGYYEILGVTCDASQDEIKKTYRKKARQLHPDCVGPESEEAFKELSIACEALPDSEKRRLYDAGGVDAPRGGASPFQGAGGLPGFFDAMLSGFSGTSSGPTPRRRRGTDQLIGVDITLKEAVFGTQKTVSFVTYIECETCYDSMRVEDTQSVTCPSCGGSGTATRISNTMFGQIQSCAACRTCGGYGTITSSSYQECAGQGRVRSRWSYPIDTPAGVTEDTRVRVPNKVEVDPGGGSQGSLYLGIRELINEIFVRRGGDLHMWTTIPMTTAAPGTNFILSTSDGECMVAIPAGTQPGEEVILKESGVGRPQRPGRGNLHVHTEVEVSKKLDARSRELLEELAVLCKEGGVEPQCCDHPTLEKPKEKSAGQ